LSCTRSGRRSRLGRRADLRRAWLL
jgi:hypothetical protein